MEIYHTSGESSLTVNDDGMFGSFLFFSCDVYRMSESANYVYVLDTDDLNLIEASSFWYRHDCDDALDLLKDMSDQVGLSIEDLCDALDESKQLVLNADQSWIVQKFQGQIAKFFGYDGVISRDEQGSVYIVDCLNREIERRKD